MSAIRIKRIFVPVDFSGASEKALSYAAELARAFSSELILFHVFDTRIVDNIYHIHQLSPETARREMRKSAEVAMKGLMESEMLSGLVVSKRFDEGLPPMRVKEVAEEVEADLIVMGTHGKTGLTQFLYGSTADGVQRGAPCPVLTVNP